MLKLLTGDRLLNGDLSGDLSLLQHEDEEALSVTTSFQELVTTSAVLRGATATSFFSNKFSKKGRSWGVTPPVEYEYICKESS